jgi:ABC-2 type transport system ATP-binding protein
MDYAIETFDLTKVYRSGGRMIRALDDLELRIRRGSVFGLLGHNGAGKTTLISILMGLATPTSGTAKVLGLDVVKQSLKIRRAVGFMPEGIGFYNQLTAEQNLEYVAALNGILSDTRQPLIEKALSTVGIMPAKDRKVEGYSKGMKQRLAIAQALMKGADLLIFDEPTAGVDPEGTRSFKNLVSQLNREEGKTLLFSTHLLSEIGPICTDIAILHKGKIIVQGEVSEIINSTMKEYGYRIELELDRDQSAVAPRLERIDGVREVKSANRSLIISSESDIRLALVAESEKCGARVLSLRRIEPSLEDLFMQHYSSEEGANLVD